MTEKTDTIHNNSRGWKYAMIPIGWVVLIVGMLALGWAWGETRDDAVGDVVEAQ